MKQLLLLRHAKAIAGSTKAGDHARPLNERGRIDAPRVAIAMQHKGYVPDYVLCSTSKRTTETWELAASELDSKPEVKFCKNLYLAPAKTIVQAIRAMGETRAVVLVIGHNPGLEECALLLARKPRSEDERRRFDAMSEKFPTAALAVLDFDISAWTELATATGQLVDFIRPKELTIE